MTVFEESRATVELAAHAVGCEPARIAKTLSFDLSALKDKNLWITVCEGDTKAFPGMNEAVARWESLGSKVERNEEFWDSHASPAEINNKAQKMAKAEAPIKYSVFAGGNHMYTWSFAYDIEAVRDWLFAQRLDSRQERGKGHSSGVIRPGEPGIMSKEL